jgi:hypothetical protein
MSAIPRWVHRLVGNRHASGYVLIMMLAFGLSVVLTRLYLALANYPQLGGGVFHIAHALWGGLLLVVAPVLLLMYVNRWVFTLSALLAGAGVGLFIDEVGKFITQKNDYFFPLAAPIIYVVFLLTVFVYLYTRRRRSSGARAEMYDILIDVQEILDNDLEAAERADLVGRLKAITMETDRPDLVALARSLLAFVESGAVNIVPDRETWLDRVRRRFAALEARWLPSGRIRMLVITFVALVTLLSMVKIAGLTWAVLGGGETGGLLAWLTYTNRPPHQGDSEYNAFVAMAFLEAVSCGLLVAGLGLLIVGRDRGGTRLASFAIILSLTVTNVLSFYFNQFSVVANSMVLLVVLLVLGRYGVRRDA